MSDSGRLYIDRAEIDRTLSAIERGDVHVTNEMYGAIAPYRRGRFVVGNNDHFKLPVRRGWQWHPSVQRVETTPLDTTIRCIERRGPNHVS
jgi:hypothetical protein